MAKKTYNVICQSIVGSRDDGYSIIYAMDDERFDNRQAAIDHGFTLDRSDDFNIGVWENGALVSLDWMDKPVDSDPELLSKIMHYGEVAA